MKIQSETQALQYIFSGVDTRYAVPHYQRDYSWTFDHRSEFWSDILSSFNAETEYFLGSIVLNTETVASTGSLEIVDGQQRLTTLTTLFAAIRDISSAYVNQSDHDTFKNIDATNHPNRDKADRAKNLSNNLIVCLGEPDNFYLKLNEKDQQQFIRGVQKPNAALLTNEEQKPYKAEARVLKSKKFFSRKIIDEFISKPDGFLKLERFTLFCMTKLLILRISVESDTDAYLLFETLNDRGLDLSISDLVKNRLLMSCEGNTQRKDEILDKWNQLIEKLNKSRFQPHDFLRFYWCAFHAPCSKKELYKKIKDEIDSNDVDSLVNAWIEAAEYFCSITYKDTRFPSASIAPNSVDSTYVELKEMGYSVYLPFFLKLNRERPELLAKVACVCLSYLFRIISIGRFSAGRAEKRFNSAIDALEEDKTDEEIIKCFEKDPESSDDKFVERLKTMRFDENKTARYFLAKIHLHEMGPGHPLNYGVHLEHILPQSSTAWPQFDAGERAREDWVYNIGNMTLLEEAINKSLHTSPFTTKVGRFNQRTSKQEQERTAIPMTYNIYQTYISENRDWDREWIMERAQEFACKATEVWKLDVRESQQTYETLNDNDVDTTEQS
mgnify:CR=1 FL=1